MSPAVPAARGDRTVAATEVPSLRSWVPWLVVLAMIWGASFVFIKVAVAEIHPLWVAAGRLVFGGIALAPLVLLGTRTPGLPTQRGLPRELRPWLVNGFVGVVGCALPFSLFSFAGERIPSMLSGLWNSTTPLIVLPLAVLAFRTERFTVRRLAGLALGLAGALVILGVWDLSGGGYDVAGQLMCLAATSCYGVCMAWTRRYISPRPESPAVAAALQMITGTVAIIPVALLVVGPPAIPGPAALGSVIALGALGTGLAFLINIRNITRLGASAASSVTYLVPVFATVIGVTVLGETLTWHQVVGGLVVLAGVAVAQGGRRSGPPRPIRSAAS